MSDPLERPFHKSSVTYADIQLAATQLSKLIHTTPVVTSNTVNRRVNSQVFFKCESFQKTGSFKVRGAFNALSRLTSEQKQQGILTYSSGNHAQAIAFASQQLHIPATIIMPEDAPAVKQAATREYGAEILLYNRQTTNRETLAQELATQRGLTLIPPYDHPHIIAGQGTTAKELFAEIGELDLLLVPCGGGGLLSGCAIAAHELSPKCQVIGVEPKRADDATRSFHSGTLQTVDNPETVADGARTPSLGQYTFPLVLHYVSDMVTVSDAAILRSMFFLWERLKLVVEPTGALAATALLEGIISVPNARIGVIISGGNVDLKQVGKLFTKANSTEKNSRMGPLAMELS